MSKTFIISDTHLSHRAEFIWRSRGFGSMEEMNKGIIENWNNSITDNDIVFHLGDVVFQPASQTDAILPQLKGKKILILGNHDRGKYLIKYFEDFYSIKEHDIFVFSHMPLSLTELNTRYLGKINVHGHIHLSAQNSIYSSPQYINVNCEFIEYKPILMDSLVSVCQPWLRKDCKLILIRGLPGSGKTTLAESLKSTIGSTFNHFEADSYFLDEKGDYCFVGEKLPEAHLWCYANTANSLIKGNSCIVSNTFTTKKEMSPYIHLAAKLGVELEVKKCIGNYPSIHSVPKETVEKMRLRWEDFNLEKINI